MNAIQVLESQQGDLEDLFHEISGAKDEGTRRQILGEITENVALLCAFEGHVLRRMSAASPALRLGLRERVGRIEQLASELRSDEGAPDAKVVALQDEIERQLDEVETSLLPRLAAMGEEGLWVLGVELIAIRRAFASRVPVGPAPARLVA